MILYKYHFSFFILENIKNKIHCKYKRRVVHMGKRKKIMLKYEFIGAGSVICEEDENFFYVQDEDRRLGFHKRDTLFLDVGGSLREGVIDPHCLKDGMMGSGRYSSTAALLPCCRSLILGGIDPEAHEITVVLHKGPGFDSFTSAYLVRELLASGDFPEHYELLTDYAEKIDSGLMKLSPDNIRAPFAVVYAFDYIIQEDMRAGSYGDIDKTNAGAFINALLMKRGIELVEYIMNRLSGMHDEERSLYNPSVFPRGCPFEREIELIKDDYGKYLMDIRSGRCEKRKVKLPAAEKSSECLKEVDALFWIGAPASLLGKYWARQDKDSPSGDGYACTFIPDSMPESSPAKSSVIISVDPAGDICLRGLAQYLEKEECIREDMIFGSGDDRKRDRSTRRFIEDWCTNSNPWFDGRNYGYTIVAPPRGGSLLAIDEIRTAFINYTKPRVINNFVRLVLPFSYGQDRDTYVRLCSEVRKSSNFLSEDKTEGTLFDSDRADYFLPYIQKYMFRGYTSEGGYSLSRSARFKLSPELEEQTGSKLSGYNLMGREGESIISNSYLTLFRYGVGFLVLDIHLKPSLLLEQLLAANRTLCETSSADSAGRMIFDGMAGGELGAEYGLQLEQGLIYTSAEILPGTFFQSEREEMLYKLCNIMDWDEPFSSCQHVDYQMQQMFFDIGEYAIYGFSKNGGALLVSCDEENTKIYEQMKYTWKRFMNTDFDIFMLALHQRKSLMQFANKLAEYDNLNRKKKIRLLRSNLMDFTTQGWFSQITNNELGSELYEHWQKVLQNTILYDEVFSQLSAMDDYNSARSSRIYERFSYILVPMVIINALISIGLFETTPLKILGVDYWGPIGIFTALTYLLMVYLFKRK
jgi:hypothetical protein